MGLRVHELAKEFKISTAALKKHLSDLGFKVKSHMSIVDEDIAKKIRAKFHEQVAAIKKIETDRIKYHMERPRPENNSYRRETRREPQRPLATTHASDNTHHKADSPDQAKKNIPVFKPENVHNIDKTRRPAGDTQSAPRSYDNRSTQGDNRTGGYQGRNNDNRSGGYQGRPSGDNRTGGYQGRNNDNRSGGYQGRPSGDNRTGGYQGRPSGDNRTGGYQGRPSGDNRTGGYQGRPSGDNRTGGYQGRNNDNRSGGYQGRSGGAPHSGGRPYTPRPGGTPKPGGAAPKPGTPAADALAKRKFGKTKKDYDDQKNKHLKAKIGAVQNKKKKKYKPTEEEEAAIRRNISRTMAGTKKKKYKKEEKVNQEGQSNEIVISEFTSVSELAKIMDISPSEIIAKFFKMGQMVTINQRLDKDSLEMVCDEFNFQVSFQDEFGTDILEVPEDLHADVEAVERAPIVTIMGHVDHGKTSILDHIRNTRVVAGESGGITQHIGAYQVTYKEKRITFLDTPGHEAFSAMRSRGANVTDIAIIVVAANDGVMPQTVEAIDHAKAAGVKIIVAINKMDLPNANKDRTIHSLLEKGVYLEQYGGEVAWVETSALTGEGIDDLLDIILLTAEMNEITAKKDIPGKGIVIEAEKNHQMGAIATILLQEGELERGNNIVCGATYGRVRKMTDERGKEIKKIGPADVAVLYGLNDVPKAGDIINRTENEKVARQISSERRHIRQERENYQNSTNLNNLFEKIRQNQMDELKIIIKADTDGSVEALADSFQKITNDEVSVNIIHKSVGGIIEADVSLASASDAIIVGFHVRANNKAKKLAVDEGVEVKIYAIIYDAIDDIKLALSGMLAPEIKEVEQGNALVKEVFRIKKVGQIAGCYIEKGTIKKDAKIRLFRNNIMIHEGQISSLKHYANDVNEVKAGSECGIGLLDYNDIKNGDVMEAYEFVEVKRKV